MTIGLGLLIFCAVVVVAFAAPYLLGIAFAAIVAAIVRDEWRKAGIDLPPRARRPRR